MLFQNAELDGRTRADVRVAGNRITEIGNGLTRRAGEKDVDCEGGALLPGLCDHHLHLHALAAQRRSVRCGPTDVTDRDGLAAALRDAVPDEHGWVRGVGYIETVAGDLDATALDALHADRPVRVQHRSGALWMLNSAAVRATGAEPTGRLWRSDDWLRDRLPPGQPPDLRAVGAELLRLGITAVTDATPDLGRTAVEAITAAVRDGALPQRVHLLGCPTGLEAPRITVGPYKIVLADSGLPALDDLVARIRHAHAEGRGVAVHCVTREALFLLLAALTESGVRPGDRIEHASVVPGDAIDRLAKLGLRVVTQPGFLPDRGDDYLRDVDARDRPDLYRCASLLEAGVPVALASDAPYGPLDPWAVMDAAVQRRTEAGVVLGAGERVSPRAALRSYLGEAGDPGGPPRRVSVGAAAGLVLLHVPLAEALARPSADLVRSVVA
ncbi:amidohydrolase family protein [Actinomadura barringtoniae]|uniref:Amidohydrolase family protein n=1 Tax=Actinomadura barringtoniae TaxID=1427535 RepID=A0A939P8D4_9ACTN|nr:amidohydrolase family protein [Actinomadura barringtoniae]MBO2447665.1 amidohydrolase family protein [Actinomadura barringtoniae]